ncbi:MAG: hypothetical protein ACYTFK_05140 [Planctomycetota bacterium]|jgi:hypothetical protein
MMHELVPLLANFTAPEYIGNDARGLLWIFPLLASVAIIYKTTKMRVLFLKRFFKETVILFCTLSIVMVLVAVTLHLIVRIATG